MHCVDIFLIFAVVIKKTVNMVKPRTEMGWRELHNNAICAILTCRTANPYYGDWSIKSIISDAISGADTLVNELKKKEEKEIQSPPSP